MLAVEVTENTYFYGFLSVCDHLNLRLRIVPQQTRILSIVIVLSPACKVGGDTTFLLAPYSRGLIGLLF